MSTLYITLWDPVTASPIGDAGVSISEPSASTLIGAITQALPPEYAGQDLYLGARRIPPASTFADAPIVAGSIVSVGGPGPPATDHASVAGILRVTHGQDAGDVFPLAPGLHDIARRADASITLTDQEVTRRGHTRVIVGASGRVTVEDLGSANGTWIDGRRVPPQVSTHAAEAVPLAPGSELRVGTTVLSWSPRPGPRRSVARSPGGELLFDRSFTAAPPVTPVRVRLPVAHAEGRNIWTVLVPLVIPLVVGAALAAVLRQPLFLLFAILGPVSGLGSHLVEGRQRRRRRAATEYERAEVAAAIAEHVRVEREYRHQQAPGPAEVLMAATGVSDRLWPRDAGAPDSLVLRLGLADQPAEVTLDGEPGPGLDPPVVRGVPATLDLRAAGVLGVTGSPAQTSGLIRWLVVQLATLRSPSDLRLVLISATDGAGLAWMRWLPHLAAGAEQPIRAWVGNTPATRLRRVAELQELVTERLTAGPPARVEEIEDVVVILDGALALRQTPGMHAVLRDGPSVGVYVIGADIASMNEAGAGCRFVTDDVLQVTSRAGASLDVAPESCDPRTAELVARSIAPLRDRLTLSHGAQLIPYPVRFLDLLGIAGAPTPEQIRERWRRQPGPVTEVPIGADAQGVVTVDLAGQGPHTMLGGATGAGKSYLLQSLVTSLLMANSPDELNLVLIDFKGGSAFLPFQDCPHVVSLIRSTGATAADVFDQAAATRVLASVRTEVARREAALAPFGGEIDTYWRARRTRPELPALPRLVLVFDEFARVLDVGADLLTEIVAVAAKGRALGMHLVLATQSLQGKLSPELKNAIDLRISLRQNEPSDSMEVLGTPAAARIPGRRRGRGLILCTKDEPRVARPFQAGSLGRPPPGAGPPPARVRPVGWTSAGQPVPDDPEPDDGPSDLELAVGAIEAAGAGYPAPHRPLLPPLPARLTLADLDQGWAVGGGPAAVAPFAVMDDPGRQAQPVIGLDLRGTERVLVAGGPQQGRTTFARTLIDSLTTHFGPDEVHLYVVARDSSELAGFEGLAHCGGVISGAEPDRLRRLAEWLAAEAGRRRGRPTAAPVDPAIVVIIDGWASIENRSDPAYLETRVIAMMREVIATGVTTGIHVVAIGGQDLLSSTVSGLFERRLVLAFPKEDGRRQHLPVGAATQPAIPGRAVDGVTGRPVQLCLPARTDHEIVQDAGQFAERLAQQLRPVLIHALPQQVPVPSPDREGRPPGWIPLGVGGAHLDPVGVELFGDAPGLFLISGPPGSGRTTAIRTVLGGLLRWRVPVLLVAAGRSPLAGLRPVGGRLEVLTGAVISDAALRAAAARLGAAEYAVLVDDGHELSVTATVEGFSEQPTLLAELCRLGGHRRALVMAGDAGLVLGGQRRSLSAVVHEMLAVGHRLLLTPSRGLEAREQGFVLEADQLVGGPPGRGYLASGRTVTLIQVGQDPELGSDDGT